MELRGHRQEVQPLSILGLPDSSGHALRGRWVIYYYLVQSLKRRLVLELQDSFAHHPIYEKIVPYIQNKFVFQERPQFGIVVKNSTANKVSLSADNFVGTVESHVMLANVGQPVYPLEWVREDLQCVQQNNDVMPTPPGIYYLEILEAPDRIDVPGYFAIDPLLTQIDEPVIHFISGIEQEGQLQHVPVQGTMRLWQNHHYLLVEGTDYSVDYTSGAIRFEIRFNPQTFVTADYRYAAPSIGPVPFFWNQSNTSILEGVVLAFGKRARKGDKVAIVVYPDRVEAANGYGGRFDATFEMDVISRDPMQMEEIADLAIMYLWGQKRAILSTEGIEINNVSMGGESEEAYDETADLMYYMASLSIEVQADWEIHIPLPLTISRVTGTTGVASAPVTSMANDLFFSTVPILTGRNNAFERIK